MSSILGLSTMNKMSVGGGSRIDKVSLFIYMCKLI